MPPADTRTTVEMLRDAADHIEDAVAEQLSEEGAQAATKALRARAARLEALFHERTRRMPQDARAQQNQHAEEVGMRLMNDPPASLETAKAFFPRRPR